MSCAQVELAWGGITVPHPGGWEIRRHESARIPWIKETEPLGMALVLSKVNMRSVDRNPPLISRYQLFF